MTSDPWGGWQAFSDAARGYMDGISKAAPQNAAAQFSDFLREQFASYSQPWASQSAGAPPWASAFAMPSAAPPSAAAADVPAFGATREHQERAQRMAQAQQRMEAAQRRLQRLWSDVLREASAKFVAQLPAMPPAITTPESLRKLYDSWIDCAEEAYAHVAHGEAYCQAQGEFANASSQWRLEQQANIEQWSKFLDLPTRSELNSMALRLRAAEEQLRVLSRSSADPAPAPGAASSKRAKAKKKRP